MRARAAEIEAVLVDVEPALRDQSAQLSAAMVASQSPRDRNAKGKVERVQRSPAEMAWEIAEFETRLQVCPGFRGMSARSRAINPHYAGERQMARPGCRGEQVSRHSFDP